MAKLKMTSRIISQEMISPDIYSMWLSAAEIAGQAAPGQFISLYCQDSGRILPRPISICEIDKEKGALRIVYRIAGAGTREFSQKQPGETIDILGPLGNGFPNGRNQREKSISYGGRHWDPSYAGNCKTVPGRGDSHCRIPDKNVFLQEEFEKAGKFVIATEDGSLGTKGNVMDVIREKTSGSRPDLCLRAGSYASGY